MCRFVGFEGCAGLTRFAKYTGHPTGDYHFYKARSVLFDRAAREFKGAVEDLSQDRDASFYVFSEVGNLLQTLDKVKVRQGSVEPVDVGFSVGRYQDWPDGCDSGRIGGHELFPRRALSRGRV